MKLEETLKKKIPTKISILAFLIMGAVILAFFSRVMNAENTFEQARVVISETKETNEPENKDMPCGSWDWSNWIDLDEALISLDNNEYALSILKNDCKFIQYILKKDFDWDGKKEIAIVAADLGCASCHGNYIYIVKEDKTIFYKATENVFMRPTTRFAGFELKEPIRKDGEGYCCPSEGTVTAYQFDKTKNEFVVTGKPKVEAYDDDNNNWQLTE